MTSGRGGVAYAIDSHCHLGRFFEDPTRGVARIEEMRRGGMTACIAAVIGDRSVIGMSDRGLRLLREPAPGELFDGAARDLDALWEACRRGGTSPAAIVTDIERLRETGGVIVAAIEGLDCLEGRVERVAHFHDRGVRVMQLVHYRINELGDIQTEPPRHGGLTAFGREVVEECARLGILVDVAHATFETVKGVVGLVDKPIILSHSILGDRHPRCIDDDHARLVASTGGMIGAWATRLAVDDFDDYIDNIVRLTDAVGADHVGIGTDMDAVRAPVYDDYSAFYVIPDALRTRGMAWTDIEKISGGNFMRVFAAAVG
ncbi:MAG: membrane dipeptidase [Rhodospirillales bacterium]|nr:MAG: membrane dipeptidase [Rhodospirillales bacterium]